MRILFYGVSGCGKTPLGLHCIQEKIGDRAHPFTVFKSRKATGEIASPMPSGDAIVGRILWLSGLQQWNRLDSDQVEAVLKHEGHFPGHERDEQEINGYYAALTQLEKWVAANVLITEKRLQTLRALVMSNGRTKVKPTEYRDGQNMIRDSRSKASIYMPPEAKDVKGLMTGMVNWIHKNIDLPCPIIAGLVHYQFVTIHPYYDGNGRTARLLSTFILHLGGYDLKGIYSLEEYYARNLDAYYQAISVGTSHNYYMGRAEADLTKWVEYFVEGMAGSFENVLNRMEEAKNQGLSDHGILLRQLDQRQRKALQLFQDFSVITSRQIGELFGFKPRTSAALCSVWVEKSFLEIVDSSNKARKYKLSKRYESLIK